MSQSNYITLMSHLAGMPDPRDRRGRRYEWDYLVTLVAAAMLAGYGTYKDMAAWVDEHAQELVACLKPKRARVASESTLRRTVCGLEVTELERRIAAYVQELDEDDRVSGQVVTQRGAALLGQSVDGKTVRGASAHGETVLLVSIVRHESGAILKQTRETAREDERKTARALLDEESLVATVTTLDALHTSVTLAQQIVDAGGDYLMVVKRNQPTLYADIALAFEAFPPVNAWEKEFWAYQRHVDEEFSHGRFEYRLLESTTALNDYLAWPNVGQVLRRTRWHQHVPSGKSSWYERYAITSLRRDQVSLEQIAQLWRWHWTIENRTHYCRDVSMHEDQNQAHAEDTPQVLAALRNAILSLIHVEGWHCVPDAFRYFRSNVPINLRFLGATAT